MPACTHTDDERLTQVWFAGAHANVGGGYPDDALSYVPLRWIIAEATKRGVRFNPLAIGAVDVKDRLTGGSTIRAPVWAPTIATIRACFIRRETAKARASRSRRSTRRLCGAWPWARKLTRR